MAIETANKPFAFRALTTGGLRFALTRLRGVALDLLYPATCASCGEDLTPNAELTPAIAICDRCVDQLALFSGPTCSRCGAPIPEGLPPSSNGCFHCRGRKLWFDNTLAAGEYAGGLRELVLEMKPASGDRLSFAMGELLWSRMNTNLQRSEIDVVAPIPMHWRRRLIHRTNSAAVLADVLAARLACPVAERLLRRRRNTPPQFSRTPPQRWENVRRAFSVSSAYHLREAHVLLVDDILTTGATCSEAARALRDAGAARVTVVVVARALNH